MSAPERTSLSSCLPPVTDRTWVEEELPAGEPTERRFTEPLSPVGIFSVTEYTVSMTNLYAHRDKGKHSFSTDANEMGPQKPNCVVTLLLHIN